MWWYSTRALSASHFALVAAAYGEEYADNYRSAPQAAAPNLRRG
ncbi:hypothetical protein ACIQF6_27980 [Kitasatospora sp. NPDC092948]